MTTTLNSEDLLAAVTGIIEKFDEKTEKKAKAKKEKKEPKEKKVKPKKLTKKETQIGEMARQTFLPNNYKTVWNEQELYKLAHDLKLASYITIDSETMGVNPFSDQIVGLSLFFNGFGYYIPLKHSQQINESFDKTGKTVGIDYVDCLPLSLVTEVLKPLLEDRTKRYIFHNFKFDYHVFKNWLGIDMVSYYDTAIAQSLLDETVSRRLKDLATMYLKIPSDTFSTLFGKVTFDNVPILLNEDGSGNLATYYATKDSELTMKLFDFQMSHIDTPRLAEIKTLLFELEMPFLHIVAKAEQKGVLLDTDYLLSNVKVSLDEKLKDLVEAIYKYTGEINLNSPIQVADALYERLGIKRVDKKKPNSTDKRILNKIKKEHQVIPLFLQFKSLSKLITAFVDKLPLNTVKGRIHTSFNTLGAKTGRMSSNSPNLQQIPNADGGLIRKAFKADEGRLLASIDFSSQELRWLAHFSEDNVLNDIYMNDKDVHCMTATSMWNLQHQEDEISYEFFELCFRNYGKYVDKSGTKLQDNIDDLNSTDNTVLVNKAFELGFDRTVGEIVDYGIYFDKLRKQAKSVNFGIVYGIGEYKLADMLEIGEEQAKQYIEAYFKQYPSVKVWMDKQKQFMRKNLYTQTFAKRKRRVHNEMMADKAWQKERGYRMGINAIIQGSSADQVKIASIKLQPLLKELDAQIVLWVHDEVIFDVPESIGKQNLQRIADIMCNCVELSCGMKSDIEVGKVWSEKLNDVDLENFEGEEDFDEFEEFSQAGY